MEWGKDAPLPNSEVMTHQIWQVGLCGPKFFGKNCELFSVNDVVVVTPQSILAKLTSFLQ